MTPADFKGVALDDLVVLEQVFSLSRIFDIYVTEYMYGTVLTTILPILFLYLNTVIVTAGTFEP
jgi:hypothetical protein